MNSECEFNFNSLNKTFKRIFNKFTLCTVLYTHSKNNKIVIVFCCNHLNDETKGGVVIYVKNDLKHHKRADYSTLHILAACITIELIKQN